MTRFAKCTRQHAGGKAYAEYLCAEAAVTGLKSNKSEWNRGIPPPSPLAMGRFLFCLKTKPTAFESE
jgi:hypothetical protein